MLFWVVCVFATWLAVIVLGGAPRLLRELFPFLRRKATGQQVVWGFAGGGALIALLVGALSGEWRACAIAAAWIAGIGAAQSAIMLHARTMWRHGFVGAHLTACGGQRWLTGVLCVVALCAMAVLYIPYGIAFLLLGESADAPRD